MSSMFLPLKRYADFQGRSGRKEYWMFLLFQIMVSIAVNLVSYIGASMESSLVVGLAAIVSGVFGLAMFIPGLAVSVRRMHDIDKSGWQLLWAFVPLVGAIILIIFMAKQGTTGPNRFGPAPTLV